ncbi:MAG: filamentous hemagglutinin N-terminal domain-containing protein, partial [Symploca sp. SIO1A3]|nr:filamentous hemagglutinin N-terminal domain-containing protein [Symploca sp. SIO1A3]
MHFSKMSAVIFRVGGLLVPRHANQLPLKKGKKTYYKSFLLSCLLFPSLEVLGVGFAFCLLPSVLAQIIPDATLGSEGSRIIEGLEIQSSLGDSKALPLRADRIEGGALRGANLFHSFLELNVLDGQRVYFANPAGIENILSRVTGSNGSDILGTLGVLGEANLFLVNPNGIVFGHNAQLDVAGSFVASTENELNFSDGSSFSATNPEAPQLLAINVTPGMQWGTSEPQAAIVSQGNLAVGQDLTLAGSRLTLSGQLQAGRDLTLLATDTVKIRDSTNHPFIASADGELLVQGNQMVDIFALNHPDSGLFSGGNLVLRSANSIIGDAHYWSEGTFKIEQLDSNSGSWLSPNDPVIRANGDVSFDSYQGASLHIFAGGSVKATGDIEITGADATNGIQETVTLSDGTKVEIDGKNEPTLDIRAGTNAFGTPVGRTGDPEPINFTDNNTPSSADITINGTITNNQGLVFLTNQYQPNALAGNITVNNIDVKLRGNNIGNGGSIVIDSHGNFTLMGIMSASTFGEGDAGDISIQASGAVELDGADSIIFNNVEAGGVGNAGNISIKADSFSLTDGAQLISTTFGEGNAGSISIQASGAIELDNSNIFNDVEAGGVG